MSIEAGRYYYNEFGTLQIIINGPGCFYRRDGYCRMCNYGGVRGIAPADTVMFVDNVIQKHPDAKRILIGSNGSFLDEREVPGSVLSSMLSSLSQSSVKNIYIETHADTINPNILAYLMSRLPEKNITIEIGLESSNSAILRDIINKRLDLEHLRGVIKQIHDYDMLVATNVLYGLWYEKDLMQTDFVETCHWANANGADEIVVFLLHIRPGTDAHNMYRHGKITLPVHDDFIATLSRLDDETLEKVYLSWYGERKEAIEEYDIVPPVFGNLSPEKVMQF